MKLSDSPQLKEARDRLARKLHKRRGGDYLTAVTEANGVIRRGYRAGGGGRKAVARAVTEAKTAAVAGKRRKKLPARGVSEATQQAGVERAVDRAIREALKGRAAPDASGKPAARPITELSEGELGAAFHSVLEGTLTTPFMLTESAPAAAGDAPPAAQPPVPDGTPLHKLDLEAGDAVMGAGVGSYAQGYGLVSPFWR